MDDEKIAELQSLFDSIVCLTVEGPEYHTKLELMDAIKKEAIKGYDLCRHHLTSRPGRVADNCAYCDAPVWDLEAKTCWFHHMNPPPN